MVGKQHGPDSIDHPGDLLLPYLEDRLSGEDRVMVQGHVDSCKECSDELQMLEELMARLKTNKDVFCPEPSRLFEFAETGEDSEGKLARHVERCPMCQKDVAAYRAGCQVAVLPGKVRSAYRERFPQSLPAKAVLDSKGLFANLREWLSSLFKVPTFALATVAAAVLVLVLVYPRGEIEPFIGLSSVTWKQADDDFAPKSLFAEPIKPRVALLLYFKGFKKPWDQSRIDALFEALGPVVEGQDRAEVLSPAEIQALVKAKTTVSGPKELAKSLGKDLDVSSVVILDAISGWDGFRIEGRAIDAASGETMRRESVDAMPENQLPAKLRDAFRSLLESKSSVK